METDSQIDLSLLIDFDAPVICSSSQCKTPGETAVAMITFTYCPCRYVIGLNCVQRLVLGYAQNVVEGVKFTAHERCGTYFPHDVMTDSNYYEIISL